MNTKRTSMRTRRADVPYDPKDRKATAGFWASATPHEGAAGWRCARGRPPKAAEDRKEEIALRVDKDVLEKWRAQCRGWQTRMNAMLKAYRDATG